MELQIYIRKVMIQRYTIKKVLFRLVSFLLGTHLWTTTITTYPRPRLSKNFFIYCCTLQIGLEDCNLHRKMFEPTTTICFCQVGNSSFSEFVRFCAVRRRVRHRSHQPITISRSAPLPTLSEQRAPYLPRRIFSKQVNKWCKIGVQGMANGMWAAGIPGGVPPTSIEWSWSCTFGGSFRTGDPTTIGTIWSWPPNRWTDEGAGKRIVERELSFGSQQCWCQHGYGGEWLSWSFLRCCTQLLQIPPKNPDRERFRWRERFSKTRSGLFAITAFVWTGAENQDWFVSILSVFHRIKTVRRKCRRRPTPSTDVFAVRFVPLTIKLFSVQNPVREKIFSRFSPRSSNEYRVSKCCKITRRCTGPTSTRVPVWGATRLSTRWTAWAPWRTSRSSTVDALSARFVVPSWRWRRTTTTNTDRRTRRCIATVTCPKSDRATWMAPPWASGRPSTSPSPPTSSTNRSGVPAGASTNRKVSLLMIIVQGLRPDEYFFDAR